MSAAPDELPPDVLQPGDDQATTELEDAVHWAAVYAELVRGCADLGVRNERFEARLAYWRRVLHGHGGCPHFKVEE